MPPESSFFPGERHPARSLRDFPYLLSRHKWKGILYFLVVMIVVIAGTFLATEIYRAEAKLLVRLGRESLSLDPATATRQVVSLGQSRESEISAELEILKSRELAIKVVDALGASVILDDPDEQTLGTNFVQDQIRRIRKSLRAAGQRIWILLEEMKVISPMEDREKAVTKLMKNLAVETQKDNTVLSLSFEGQTPGLAQGVLNKLVDLYLEKNITAHRARGSDELLDKQPAKAEEELKKLKDRSDYASLPEQHKLILNRISTLQQEAEATQAALAISRAKIGELKKKLTDLPQTQATRETRSSSDHGIELTRSKLYELKRKEQELLSKYSETAKPVKKVRRQIAEAQAQLAKEETSRTEVMRGINTTYQQLNLALLTEMATLSYLESKDQAVKTQLEVAQGEIKDLTDAGGRMPDLERGLALGEMKSSKQAENLEQARTDPAVGMNTISNISVVQAAAASEEPVKPRKALIIVLGFLLAILGGIGLIFFCEYREHSIKTSQEVEAKFNIPVLASIPGSKKTGGANVREFLADRMVPIPQEPLRPGKVFSPEAAMHSHSQKSLGVSKPKDSKRPRPRVIWRPAHLYIGGALALGLIVYLGWGFFLSHLPPAIFKPGDAPIVVADRSVIPSSERKVESLANVVPATPSPQPIGDVSPPKVGEKAEPKIEAKPAAEVTPPQVVAEPKGEPQPAVKAEPKPAAMVETKQEPKPEIKAEARGEARFRRVIGVVEGGTLYSIARAHYHQANTTLIDYILEFNPGIENIHQLPANQKIRIPEIREETLLMQSPDGSWKIHLGTHVNQGIARRYGKEPLLKGKEIEIIKRQVSPEDVWYRVFAKKFDTREEGLKRIQKLRKKGLLAALKD